MNIYFSPSTAGFYESSLHGDSIPQDAVEISPAYHIELLIGQSEGKRITADQSGRPILQDPPPPTAEQIRKSLTDAVQSHMDAAAQAKGYDSIMSACSYAAFPNAFQAEGQAFLVWRADCWVVGYGVLADVEAGNRPIPTEAELIAELPELVLPG